MVLAAGAVGVTVAAGCVRPSASGTGSRIVTPPTEGPTDEPLKPRNWRTTSVKIGSDYTSLASLDSPQTLQLPSAQIPFIARITFHAPAEARLVMLGLYYDRSDQNPDAKNIMTGGTLGLLRISDLDAALTSSSGPVESVTSANVSTAELNWFMDNRLKMVEQMKSSAQGVQLSQTYDSNFTTRARPPDGTPCALVLTGGKYQGADVPFTVFAQQLVFVSS